MTFGLVAAGWLTGIDEASSWLHRVRADRLAVQFGGAAGTLAPLGDAGPRGSGAAGRRARAGPAGAALAHRPAPDHRARRRAWPARARCWARSPATSRCWPSPRWPRSPRDRRGRPAGDVRRGGSSAMPHKRNPVAAVVILGCARRAPGLLATLAAAGEQEHQRAAGAWHAEWEPLADLLRLTGSASRLGRRPAGRAAGGRATGCGPTSRQRAASRMAEHLAALLAPVLGPAGQPTTWSPRQARRPHRRHPLRDALLDHPGDAAGARPGAGPDPRRHRASPPPRVYLGAAAEFIRDALPGGSPNLRRDRRRMPWPCPGQSPVRTAPERTAWAGASVAQTGGRQVTCRPRAGLRFPEDGPGRRASTRCRDGTRREVLGDDHVDRAVAGTTEFTAPFQDFITRYAWGDIWSRPGLSRAERSMITLDRLAALRQEHELAMHVRAALRNGLTPEPDPGGPAPGRRVRRGSGRQPRVRRSRARSAGAMLRSPHSCSLSGLSISFR